MTITYEWRGDFEDAAVDALHAEGFAGSRRGAGWRARVERHSLGWVCAWQGSATPGGQPPAPPGRCSDLVGFVNVIGDGGAHAVILDTVVAQAARHRGVGTGLVAMAARQARAAGCEWLHVDFEDHLAAFYFQACGFTPTSAGLIALGRSTRAR